MKGLGGYHLACDATSAEAVGALRARKRREEKPLAVMVGDLEAARALAEISPAEAELLESPERPIVLIVVFFSSRWIARSSVSPVEQITATAERITSQNLDERVEPPANKDELFRLTTTIKDANGTLEMAMTAPPLAEALQILPEVESSTRLNGPGKNVVLKCSGKTFNEENWYFADSTFFGIFTCSLLEGDPAKALMAPYSLVLSETAARKYFGTASALGKAVTVEWYDQRHDYLVTGVMKDPPRESHFHPDIVASFASVPRTQLAGDVPDQIPGFDASLDQILCNGSHDNDLLAVNSGNYTDPVLRIFFTEFVSQLPEGVFVNARDVSRQQIHSLHQLHC